MTQDNTFGFKDGKFENFKKNIPRKFLENIKNTFEKTKHNQQIFELYLLYEIIFRYYPEGYVSKSGIKVEGSEYDAYCEDVHNPFENGIIENALLLYQKQFFDILYLLLGGTYRPIMIILRYMLEQASWISASIIDKNALTKNKADTNKAMSQIEFESFLMQNIDNINKKKSSEIPKNEKKAIRFTSGIVKIPNRYLKHLKTDEYSGMEIIRKIHSELSAHAHANIWNKLSWDGEDTHITESDMFIQKPSSKAFHRSLKVIFLTNKLIFYLLLIAAYEDIAYYNKKEADEFFNKIRKEVKTLTTIKVSIIEKLLEEPIKSNYQNGIIQSEETELEDEDEIVCPKCNSPRGSDIEKCVFCHMDEYGFGGNTDSDIF